MSNSSHFVSQTTVQPSPKKHPQKDETDKDAQKEADRYVNQDVPLQSKLLIGSVLFVGLLIATSN